MEVKTNFISATIGKEPYTTKIFASGHEIIADEPATHGGADKGPKPHDILISALGACTCITIKMYASRKGWKLDQVTSEVTMERKTGSGTQSTHVIQMLSFEGELEEYQIQRLLAIAAKCPVHKTLEPAMNIQIKLKN